MSDINFEIHLTFTHVHHNRLHSCFYQLCQKLEAKPLEIVLAQGDYPQQLMLSKTIAASNLAIIEARIKTWDVHWHTLGLQLKRIKIETMLEASQHLQPCYHEWHGKVKYHDMNALLQQCHQHQAHLSHNVLKNDRQHRFITMREFGSAVVLQKRVAQLQQDLAIQGWHILKQQFETCVRDSNLALDQGWLNQ